MGLDYVTCPLLPPSLSSSCMVLNCGSAPVTYIHISLPTPYPPISIVIRLDITWGNGWRCVCVYMYVRMRVPIHVSIN